MKVAAFLRDTRAAAALEFALIAIPLLTFTLAIVEMGRALFMQQSLSHATDHAARLLHIAPTTPEATLAATIVDQLFMGDPSRLVVTVGAATGVPDSDTVRSLHLQVEYEFVSVVPQLLTDLIPLSFERVVVIGN